MTKRILWLILVFLLSYRMMPGQGLLTKKEAAPDLSKIQPVSITSLKLAEECDYGFFLPDSDLIAFKVSKTISNGNYDLYKFIIYNKMGELVKELDRVFWWGGGPLLLKVSRVSSLLLIDMEKGTQNIVNLYPANLSNISINPFTRNIVYTYGVENRIRIYDVLTRKSRVLAKLGNGMLWFMMQVSRQEIVFIRPKISQSFTSEDVEPWVNVQIPMYLINLEKHKGIELTKISAIGFMVHTNYENREITFVVEEKGHLKFISTNRLKDQHKVKVYHLNREDANSYEGLLLNYGSMNKDGNLLASTWVRLLKKKKARRISFRFYSLDPKIYTPTEGDIYLLDLNGNSKKLTDTTDQIEVMCDWDRTEDDILYYDYNTMIFYLMELDMSGLNRKLIRRSSEKELKIKP